MVVLTAQTERSLGASWVVKEHMAAAADASLATPLAITRAALAALSPLRWHGAARESVSESHSSGVR